MPATIEFQSLLLWKSLCKLDDSEVYAKQSGFQSLLLWKSLCKEALRVVPQFVWVSILVVVEVPL